MKKDKQDCECIEAEKKVILITGASSGFGYDAAIKLLKMGHTVYGAARNTDKMKKLEKVGGKIIAMDVTSKSQIKQGVDKIIENEGRIDVLINSAGYGGYGMIECVDMEEAHRQMEVNVYGTISVIQEVLPYMRKEGSGRIINLSSVIGKCTVPMMGWYGASKHAIEALSDTLRMEIKKFGIDVVVVEPAPVNTGFLDAGKELMDAKVTIGGYKKSARKFRKRFRFLYKIAQGPNKVGDTLVNAATIDKPRRRYAVGASAKLIILAAKLPDFLYENIARIFFLGK